MMRIALVPLMAVANAAAAFSGTCEGQSANLSHGECHAWLSLYDAVLGSSSRDVRTMASPSGQMPPPRPGPSRTDPCSTFKYVHCSDDLQHITGLDLGGRSLSGQLPAAMAKLSHLKYLMLSFNKLTGVVPALNFSAISGCGFGNEDSCCFLSSTVSNVYDEDSDSGVTNRFACPLPEGAAEHCQAVCQADDGTRHGYGVDVFTAPDLNRGQAWKDSLGPARPLKLKSVHGANRHCQPCTPADPKEFPQCKVRESLIWNHGHISGAYCTGNDFVVFSDAVPNHGVKLEEMPKPPGSGPKTGDFSVRIWNSQSYAYRIPLRPKFLADTIVNYTGAGALAMTLNGVSMYPIMSPGVAAIDPDKKWQDGHNRDDNMKLDGQLDSCNEHAGRGFDIHYHADPSCMYNESLSGHSPLIGWAADGFPLYGKYNASHMEPDDLDRCNGHLEDADGDGTVEYHYHVSPRFPYTIACWHGDTSNMSYEDGGQPGQKQWSFDNARSRAEKDREALLPCCGHEDMELIPQWFEELQPYAPVDHDNVHIHVAAAAQAARAPKMNWMYARHGDWGTDEIARAQQILPRVDHDSNFGVVGLPVCTGKSSGLSSVDCNAWQDLFNTTGGSTSWIACSDKRLDPCSCLAANGEVACGFVARDDDRPELRIVALGLQVNGLTGTLPASLADMSALTDLQLEGNHIGKPGAPGLGGVLPELPFAQYVGCGLEGNAWSCPLPDGAAAYCSEGQPLTCEETSGKVEFFV